MKSIHEIPKSVINTTPIIYIVLIIVGMFAASVLIKSVMSFQPIIDICEWKMGEFGITGNMTIEEVATHLSSLDFNERLRGYGLTGDSTVTDLLHRMLN